MFRHWMIAFCLVLPGCADKPGRMEHPEDPAGRYREQIAVAARVLAQKETWSDRAEWEVMKSGDGWRIVAWRIEYPERKGPDRYLPWGYSVIELDSRMEAVSYRAKN